MNKDRRNWFSSKRDGTTTKEDLQHFIDSLKNQIERLIDKHGHIAEKIIEFLKLVDAEIKEGTPTDKVIDRVLAQIKIKGDPDEKLYKFVQENLILFIIRAEQTLKLIKRYTEIDVGDAVIGSVTSDYESDRHKTASILLQSFVAEQGEEISRVESDTCIQVVYFAGVGSA